MKIENGSNKYFDLKTIKRVLLAKVEVAVL